MAKGDIFNIGFYDYSEVDPRHVRLVSIMEKTDYSFLLSYKESADHLLAHATRKKIIEGEIFPIVLLYRKYVETLFNQIIDKLNIEYEGHADNLNQMWEQIAIIAKKKEALSEDAVVYIGKVVKGFNKVNSNSYGSRNFYKIDTLDDRISVDVIEMRDAIERIHRELVSPV